MGDPEVFAPIPPDLKQCQTEIPNGNTFMTLGGVVGRTRCGNGAVYLVIENGPSEKAGLIGSMTMCRECKNVFLTQMCTELPKFTFCEILNMAPAPAPEAEEAR